MKKRWQSTYFSSSHRRRRRLLLPFATSAAAAACSISCGGRSCFFSLFGLAASFRHFPGPLPGQITHQSLPPGAGSNLQPHLPRAERNLWRFSPIFFAGHFETPFFTTNPNTTKTMKTVTTIGQAAGRPVCGSLSLTDEIATTFLFSVCKNSLRCVAQVLL